MQLALPDIWTPFSFIFQSNQGQICGQCKMKAGTEYTAHSDSHKKSKNAQCEDSLCSYSAALADGW